MADSSRTRGAEGRFVAWGERHGLPITEAYLKRLDPFWELLLRWSRRVDLTGYRDRASVLAGLLAPSLALAAVAGFAEPGPVADIGSGSGIPGIPLALLHPEVPFDLIEPRERRILFLREAVALLSLRNARPVRGRVEDLAGLPLYGAAVSRAIDPLPILPVMRLRLAPGAPWWVQAPEREGEDRGVRLPEWWEVSHQTVVDAMGRTIAFDRLSRTLRLAKREANDVP